MNFELENTRTGGDGDDSSQAKEAGSSSIPEQIKSPVAASEASNSHPKTTVEDTAAMPQVSKYSKPCSLCQTPKDVLIRCQIDETRKWRFICTGTCWKSVSGGVVDGDGSNRWYRYGGMWKNKHEAASARIKGRAKERGRGWKGKNPDSNETDDNDGLSNSKVGETEGVD